MSIRPCCPDMRALPRNDAPRRAALLLAAASLLGAAPFAGALSSDRQQPMDVKSDYLKTTQGSDKAPGVAYLRGNVRIVQGSLKARGAEATVYQHADGAKDAQGNDISGDVKRVVLVGKPAHLEQARDGGGLVNADAGKIDYDNDTSVAVLSGNVTVVQQGRGTFHGQHMTYNTNTGEMESADTTSGTPVHLIFEPKNKAPAKPPATPAEAPPKKADADGQP